MKNWWSGVVSTSCNTSTRPILSEFSSSIPIMRKLRAVLGFRQKDGQWMNRDDVMASPEW